MRKLLFILWATLSFTSCQQDNPQNSHRNPTHNFSVQRLLIINDNNEVLMAREDHVWAPISFLYDQRQYLKEGLDSLANAHGIKIHAPELRGQFVFKFDYHPYATVRNYYIAKYKSGEILVPDPMAEVKWFPMKEAIEKNTVTAIKEISRQILEFPDQVWGASFLVSHVGDDHPT